VPAATNNTNAATGRGTVQGDGLTEISTNGLASNTGRAVGIGGGQNFDKRTKTITIAPKFEYTLNRLVVDGETLRIQTANVRRQAAADTKSDVKKGGLGAGAGAIVGGVLGGGKGAAIGAVTGGAATVLATKGGEVELPSGTVVSVLVQDPIMVRVALK